jgi:diguanylate cyclase (GGDEF)-like protein
MMIDLTDIKKAAEELQKANRELAHSYRKLQELSIIDDLTSIPNRRHFESFFSHEWKRGLRTKGYLSLMIVDIDYFKQYNDTYGHQEGDRCLRQVAIALQDEFRRSADLLARYGGEEFVIVLPDTPLTGAAVVAKRLNGAVEAKNIPHAGSPLTDHVTISIGVSCTIPSEKFDRMDLIKRADLALYRAKQGGRNCYETIDSSEDLSEQKTRV